MFLIEKIVKINGKVKELEPDNREIRNAFELEQYRDELQKRYNCEIEFVYKEVRA
jgi:hypothetical protein